MPFFRLPQARVPLQRPDYGLLDEATAALDKPSEQSLYQLMAELLPDAAIGRVSHRSTLQPLHDRRLTLIDDGGWHDRAQHDRDTAPGAGTGGFAT